MNGRQNPLQRKRARTQAKRNSEAPAARRRRNGKKNKKGPHVSIREFRPANRAAGLFKVFHDGEESGSRMEKTEKDGATPGGYFQKKTESQAWKKRLGKGNNENRKVANKHQRRAYATVALIYDP